MIEIISTIPEQDSTDIYLDSAFVVTFNKEIATGYVTNEYFKLYRVYRQAGHTVDSYEQANAIIEKLPDNAVSIKSVLNLQANEKYTVLVRGDLNVADGVPAGIRAVDDDTLDANFLLNFTTGQSVAPVVDSPTIEPVVVLPGDELPSGDIPEPSDTDLVIEETNVDTFSYGITSMDGFDVMFNNPVTVTSSKAASIETRSLDPRYLDVVPMYIGSIEVSGSLLTVVPSGGYVWISGCTMYTADSGVDPALLTDLPYNHEYQITIHKDYITTESGSTLPNDITYQYTSELVPMYADPYEIREAALGYISDNIPDYVIAKQIHANSKRIADYFGVDYYCGTMTPEQRALAHQYVVCKTAYDLLLSPLVLANSPAGGGTGGQTSKSLGDLSISYGQQYGGDKNAKSPLNDLKDQLKDCFEAVFLRDQDRIGVKSKNDPYYPGRRRSIKRIRPE